MNLKGKLRNHINNFYLYKDDLARELSKKRLKNRDFTIISNNCWGGEVYRDLNLRYTTPFVGLFMFAPCYLQLLDNLNPYLNEKINFTKKSRYDFANTQRKKGIYNYYPIGLIDDHIEIHFMHYSSDSEAREKWVRRLKRINWDTGNIFLKFCDRGLCTEKLIADFDKLDFPHKVCFTSQNYPELKSTVWIEECRNEPSVVDGGSLYRVGRKYFDAIDWLNGGSGQVKITQQIFNKVFL